ncbi:MAG: PHP domain-containing protein [Clostridia bacterium]|nr:PHP domain-containing protein [Clostridia bacterium]
MKVYYDLHIHTALSPCGDDDMTPNNIVNMAKILGLDVIAITDHNSVGNCVSAVSVGKEVGVVVLFGMELETAEEVHVVTLFPDEKSATEFGKIVDERRFKIKNDEKVYGKQTYLDENDEVTGNEEYLLVTATTIGIYEVVALAESFGGVAYPAHIDRYSHGLIQMLGDIDEDMNFGAVEVSANASDEFVAKYEKLGYKIVRSSDAHYLENLNEQNGNFFELEEVTSQAVIEQLGKK